MKKATLFGATLLATAVFMGPSQAADYVIDTKGQHASIQFRIKHLGYSWLAGRFDDFQGTFSFDKDKPEASEVAVTIDTASVNTNHAERDKHLRSDDFLSVDDHPEAEFVSKSVTANGNQSAEITGDLTLNGVTREIVIDADYIGGGEDPWGGHRQGFVGTTKIALKDFGIDFDLGPASQEVELTLNVEGIRQ